MINLNKIRMADSLPLTGAEYDLCCRLCDVITALEVQMPSEAAPRGVGWGDMSDFPTIHRRKRRSDFNVSFLMPNGFRDFPTIAYDDDRYTPKPDFWVRRYQRLRAALPEEWHVKIPARFGELGWNIDGFPVNRHTSVNQERILALYLLGVLQHLKTLPAPKVMEIGGGAGEMGYVFALSLASGF